ncbi:restriction endonuclease subunit S [Prevotella jejuni]|jgi:type 1 restriction-modification system specificity subunit|uniref:restriction endonuclease subunit S n=1 Tax=Prevotella jejuni TaxID=1177574 RepID=UPI0028E556E2|nr:restriction endonuclease subunit S [Prevotella jejuni]
MREDWDIRLFKDVFDLQMGKTPDRKNFSLFEGDNTWVSIKDLDGKYISSSKECISDEAAKNIKLVKRGTVIMSFKLTVGKTAIAGKDLYTNEAIMAFNLRNGYDIDASFLYYYLKNYRWEGSNKAVMGITLNKATISKHKIAIPPKATQLSIVTELDKLNELIRIKKEQLKDYDTLAQSIFYETFGDPVVNDKKWEMEMLGEVCVIERGGSPRPISAYITESEEGLNWIKIGDTIDGCMYIYSTKEKIKEEGLNKTRYVHEGDLILSNSMSFGHPYILKTSGCIHDGWLVIRDKKEVFNTIYLYYTLASKSMYYQFERMAVGGVVNNLNSKMVSKVHVTIPPLSLQNTFAYKIEQIERQKASVQKTISDLETLLASRMQYWFD